MDKENSTDSKENLTLALVAGVMIYLIYLTLQFTLPSSVCFRDVKKQNKWLNERNAKITKIERGMNFNGGNGDIKISYKNRYGGRDSGYVSCNKGKAGYFR